jgi:ASPIC/UnbV protein/VCBS repeat protein
VLIRRDSASIETLMLFPALLLSSLVTSVPQDADSLHRLSVLVENPHTGELVEAAEIVTLVGAPAKDHFVVLPEVHESELVRRLVPRNGTVELYTWSSLIPENATFELSFVDHDPGDWVIATDGQVVLVQDAPLPWQVESAGRSWIPELARLDGAAPFDNRVAFPEPLFTLQSPVSVTHLPAERVIDVAELPQLWEFRIPVLADPESRGVGCHQRLETTGYYSTEMSDVILVATDLAPVASTKATGVELDRCSIDIGAMRVGSAMRESSALEDHETLSRLRAQCGDAPPAGLTRTWLLRLSYSAEAASEPLRLHSTVTSETALFENMASVSGVALTHLEGPPLQLDIRPTMGPGAAWGDVDGDGLVDLYLVQGGGREGSVVPRNRLYKNNGNGTFADITNPSNTGDQGAGMGALFCDLDSDGDLDLYVANYGPDVLYWNDGEGVFTPSEGQLPDLDLWSAGVAASDYDRDGDLDLYITSYLDYDESKMPPMDELERYQREDPVAMLPFAFPGQRNVFLRNDVKEDGSRHFSDVTEELGLLDVQGRGMQAIFWDFDQDGDDDLYVANDVSFNTLFRNEGDGTFRDVTFLVGLDDPRGGMGLTVGDVDRDGDEDLFLTNWQLEANALYQNNLINRAGRKLHTGTFADHTVQSRLGPAGIGVTSWGCELFDADNDGDLDLFVANGYTSPDYESTGICVGQPNHFFLNDGRGRFREAHEQGGMALAERLPSRSAVACDYDQDGLLDMLVTANNSRVQLLKNRGKSLGHWINLRLAGSNGNTHAIGARVHARCGEDTFVASLRAGTGYLTGNAPELHVGLGDHAQIDELTIHWPSGQVTTHTDLATDRTLTIREP